MRVFYSKFKKLVEKYYELERVIFLIVKIKNVFSGLTAVYRSEAGGANRAGHGAWLNQKTANDNEAEYRNNSHWIKPAGQVEENFVVEYKRHAASGRYFYACSSQCEREGGGAAMSELNNALVDVPGPSNYVGYYDAASLYPSSGIYKFCQIISFN